MAPAYPRSSFYLLKILAKSCFPIQQVSIHPDVWAVRTPSVDSKCLNLSRFQAIKDSKEVETTFRAGSVLSIQEQHKWGVDLISYIHSCRDGVICKQLVQIYSLTAVFCHVCGGGRGELGQMSCSSALWNRIAETPAHLDPCAESLCCQEPTSLILLQTQI